MKKFLSLMLVLSMLLSLFSASFSANAAGATGQQIVDCAMQYIGKVPYVWGGENIDGPNPGADCSGFICRIFEKFGYNFWKNRTKLRNCGDNLGTDMSVAQLGDIIWYEGHVAIYAGKDASGNHMVVHETGGKFQNVVYTKHKIVNAELKGIIRIPGIVNDGSTVTVKKAWFSPVKESDYAAKQSFTETNAVVVNQVNKLSGVKVTQMGIYVYDANGSLIKRYVENISNVGNSTTKYHSWYDMNSEVGITLTPGTTYKYAFFGIFDGEEIIGDTYSFKTTGTAPQPEAVPEKERCEALFITSILGSDQYYIEMDVGSAIGELPEPIVYDGYTFDGYYTLPEGGEKITSGTICYGDTTYYARFTPIQGYTDWEQETPQGIVIEDGFDDEEETKLQDKEYDRETLYSGTQSEIVLTIGSPYLFVNGHRKNVDNEGTRPFIKNGRTLLPVRAVFEAMGGTVEWNGKAKVVSLKLDGYTLFLKIDDLMAWDSNGEYYDLDTPPIISNGRTMLPIRFIVEKFGGNVEWDGSTESVIISFQER